MDDDQEYTNRIALAVYEAVIIASKGEADVAVIKSGLAFDALIMVAAVMVARSAEFALPSALRAFTDAAGRTLRTQIIAARKIPEAESALGPTFDPSKVH